MSKKRTIKRKTKKDKYTGVDYDVLHKKIDEEELTISEIEKLVDVTTNSVYETQTITSGPIREVKIYPTFLKKYVPEEFRIKTSKEAKKNLNHKNARDYFVRKANTNFGKGDYYATLTYLVKNRPKTAEEAKKHIRQYIRRLNKIYHKWQKEQLPFKKRNKKIKYKNIKYMFVTEVPESNDGNWHHHILIKSVLPMDVIEEEWKYGRWNNIRKIYPDEEHITKLAKYLAKDPKGKKRWGCSKGLKEPVITRSLSKFSRKKINEMALNYNQIEEEMEKVNPGYKFIDARVNKNKFNGKWYISGRLIKID